MEKYDALRLDHQLCFPLYAASRAVVKMYFPYLEITLDYIFAKIIMILLVHL